MSNGLGIIRDGLSHGLANAAAAQAGAKLRLHAYRKPAFSHALKVKFNLFTHLLRSLFYKFAALLLYADCCS